MEKKPLSLGTLLDILKHIATEYPDMINEPVDGWILTPEMYMKWFDQNDEGSIMGDAVELVDVSVARDVSYANGKSAPSFIELVFRSAAHDGR